MNIRESIEKILPIDRPLTKAAWKRIRCKALSCCDEWDEIKDSDNDDLAVAEEVFQDQQARIVELESQRNGKKKAKRI